MKNPKADTPNILFILTDQQRSDTMGIHGNPLDLTPNFDRVAQEGTHFVNAMSCQPLCAPVRSSLQTGLYPSKTGVFKNGLPIQDDIPLLADYFNNAGYNTGYIGKWHLGGVDPGFGGNQGPVPADRRGGYTYWLGADLPEFMSDAYNAKLFNADNVMVHLPGYRVDAYTDAAINYININKEKPFFLFLSYLEPHHQNTRDDYPAPIGHDKINSGNEWIPQDLAALGGSSCQHLPGYLGMIKRIDEALGRLTDSLHSLGLLENTIVIFTSDHGCHFKTRNREYKRSCHDSSIHIPAAAIGPGFTGGGSVQELVSLIDLPPSLLDAAGIPVPEHMQGRSLLPLVNGYADDWPEEVFIQISEAQVARAVRTKRWKYSVSAPDKDGLKEWGSNSYQEEFLYDLKADPYELTNLIGLESHRKVAEVMRERLLRRMSQAGEQVPEIVEAPPASLYGHRRVETAEEWE
jgi:arylsulfatase A-like enzyme